VANCGYWFTRTHKGFHERDRLLALPQFIGIHHPTRQHQRVKLLRLDIRQVPINLDRFAPIRLVPAFYFAILLRLRRPFCGRDH